VTCPERLAFGSANSALLGRVSQCFVRRNRHRRRSRLVQTVGAKFEVLLHRAAQRRIRSDKLSHVAVAEAYSEGRAACAAARLMSYKYSPIAPRHMGKDQPSPGASYFASGG
jgi:hypothetical protein